MMLKECQLLLRAPDTKGEVASRFHQQTRFFCALYARSFCAPPNTRGVRARGRKIVVECMPVVARTKCWVEGGVLTQQVAFDHLAYARCLLGDSQTMPPDALHRGVLLVAASEGLDTGCFEEGAKAESRQ